MEKRKYEIYIGNEFLREETGIWTHQLFSFKFSLDTFARLITLYL